jgi:proteasome lid subunit RPN8/RPN11
MRHKRKILYYNQKEINDQNKRLKEIKRIKELGKEVIVEIPKNFGDIFEELVNEYDEEFIMLLIGTLKDTTFRIVDFIIPEQEITQTSCEIPKEVFAQTILDNPEYFTDLRDIENNPKCIGILHSHNTMESFFSGTDEEEYDQMKLTIYNTLSLIISRPKKGNKAKYMYVGRAYLPDLIDVDFTIQFLTIVDCDPIETNKDTKEIIDRLKTYEKTHFYNVGTYYYWNDNWGYKWNKETKEYEWYEEEEDFEKERWSDNILVLSTRAKNATHYELESAFKTLISLDIDVVIDFLYILIMEKDIDIIWNLQDKILGV